VIRWHFIAGIALKGADKPFFSIIFQIVDFSLFVSIVLKGDVGINLQLGGIDEKYT
jgi:hypothetical protein